ncbi:MAG: hypothetical protein J6X66_10275 [Lachnospiraceae bacterium]|nr:hypothetical protein [Lachnospiraceae bacterium]
MINIIITDISIMILTVISAAVSEQAYPVLLLGGILMIIATMSNMKDDEDKRVIILQMILSFVFALGQWYSCLIFMLLPLKRRWVKLMLAETAFICSAAVRLLMRMSIDIDVSNFLAHKLAEIMMLTAASAVMLLIQTIMQKEQKRRRSDRDRLKRVSLSEMHEIKRNNEMLKQSFYENKNARLMERENISRNIHNSVGHSITAAIMTLDAADMLFDKDPQEAHKRMNDASGRIRGSLEAIRSAVRALDTEDEDVSIKDLLCYTDNIINEFTMDTQISCDLIKDLYSESLILPKEHAEFLSGALSEMLTNGVKHGNATQFIVKITADSAHIKLEVKDNGHSAFNEESSAELIRNGFGLKKIMSYVQRCGGSTEFKNDNGFCSMIELPMLNK